MASKSIIVVICGLPCTGKTHLANLLQARCTLDLLPLLYQTCCSCMQSVIVSYDLLMPTTVEEQLINSSTPTSSHWKSYRQCICIAVAELVAKASGTASCANTVNDSNSKLVEEMKCQIIKLNGITDLDGSDSRFIFIIDDNMYLKSMRHEYLQVAKLYNIGFCEICLKCSMHTILCRNDKRKCKIQKNVIEMMSNKFEDPLPHKHKWETMSLIIEDSFIDNFQPCWKEICTLLRSAFENPCKPLEDITQLKEISREACSKSLIHQADNALRQQLSKIMDNFKSIDMPKHEMRSKALALNGVRQEIISGIKLKTVVIPQEIFDELQSGAMSGLLKLNTFIQKEMDKRLQGCPR